MDGSMDGMSKILERYSSGMAELIAGPCRRRGPSANSAGAARQPLGLDMEFVATFEELAPLEGGVCRRTGYA